MMPRKRDDPRKKAGTIATPQKRGYPCDPDRCPLRQAPVASPGGRYRPHLSLREGSDQPPFGALPDRRQPL